MKYLKEKYGIAIDIAKVKDYGIVLNISDMSTNGEERIRLYFNDKTGYIRTQTEKEKEGWQDVHYHKGISETYIVQKNSILYVEFKENEIFCKEHKEGAIFTTTPTVPHNIYMMKDTIIHTVKHGDSIGNQDRWYDDDNVGCKKLNALKNNLPEEILEKYKEAKEKSPLTDKPFIIVLEKREQTFTEDYRHFDKLIWQFPTWIFGLLTIGIATIRFSQDVTISENIHSWIFLGIGILGLPLVYAMYRFRSNQVMEKKVVKKRMLSPQAVMQVIFRACHNVCVNGQDMVEIPEEKTWPWHESEKRKRRTSWIRFLTPLISGG